MNLDWHTHPIFPPYLIRIYNDGDISYNLAPDVMENVMQKYGVKGETHEPVIPQYANWGISGATDMQKLLHIDDSYIQLLSRIDDSIDHNKYAVASANRVTYFQGDKFPDDYCILVRLYPKDSSNYYGGEHISILYNEHSKLLLGYTRFDAKSNNTSIKHQIALNTTVTFLKNLAPDLVQPTTAEPQLNILDIGERMVFNHALTIDNIELRWIDNHEETFFSLIVNLDHTYGLKVKMYLPKLKLWAWVIVDHTGRVVTFERNISWDFVNNVRQTQMWLHDKWLIEQGIIRSDE